MKVNDLTFGFLLVLACAQVQAQYCTLPKPMTQAQKEKAAGLWQGNYKFRGVDHEFTLNVSVHDDKVACKIENPPLAGEETDALYFFCDGGEFHVRKYIKQWSYELQGVPQNGQIKGMLKVWKNTEKPETGEFILRKRA